MQEKPERPPTNTKRIEALEGQVAALALAVQVLSSPLNKTTAAAPAPATTTRPPKAQRDDASAPTCVNFRRCNNRSPVNLPIQPHHPDNPGAIGWKCGGELPGCH